MYFCVILGSRGQRQEEITGKYLRQDYFCWITLPTDLKKKVNFQKKRKERILAETTGKILVKDH